MGGTNDVFVLQVSARQDGSHVVRLAHGHLDVHRHLAFRFHHEALEARLLGGFGHFLEVQSAHLEELLSGFLVQPTLKCQRILVQVVGAKSDVVLNVRGTAHVPTV